MEQNLQNYNEQDNEIEIDIMDLISALWHKAPVIILSGVLLALLAVVGRSCLFRPLTSPPQDCMCWQSRIMTR